jgi:lipopolysaccharide biosynthesis protein
MENFISKDKSPIILDFDKVWRILPFNRQIKENLKFLLFTAFPFFFYRFAVYQNWKNAQVYKDKNLSFWSLELWRRSFSKSFTVRIQTKKRIGKASSPNPRFAIAIHAFYPEIFHEILQMLEQSEYDKISLYVTAPADVLKTIEGMLNQSSFPFRIMEVENRGRDILPFLKILPQIFDDGNELLLKIHTKKSDHLNRKDLWRSDLFNKLIGNGAINNALTIFENNPSLGIIGPAKHILPMYYYYGANALSVINLSKLMGVETGSLNGLNFVAGSMFFATKEALLPILNLGLNDGDFEIENNQTDGTMAHAVERAFAAALFAAKLQLSDTDYNNSNPVVTVSKNHYFTI